MARLVLANQATAAKRRVYFDCRDATDGITAETGEAAGQPQISTNGAAWTNTGIGTLSAIGNGRYYADLTQAAVATAGDIIETRYKSAATAEVSAYIKDAYDHWQDYFIKIMQSQPFQSINWQGQDKNMKAHNSLDEYITWFGASPPFDEPYRDNGFYIRELTILSIWLKPKKIVELGTNFGAGTFLLARLNPQAQIITVDNRLEHYHEGNQLYPNGYIAKLNNVQNIKYHFGNSWDYVDSDIDLAFIDASHDFHSVCTDSKRCWLNRNQKKWAIAWHDYQPNHPLLKDCAKGIEYFLEEQNQIGYCFADGTTVFALG